MVVESTWGCLGQQAKGAGALNATMIRQFASTMTVRTVVSRVILYHSYIDALLRFPDLDICT